MNWRVPLADVKLGPEEEAAVLAVMRSGWLTMGQMTQSFEDAFAQYINAPYALAVSSCTAALHIACKILGLEAGDEVILPSLTFVATANAVRYTGATPVFADIVGLDNLTISPAEIEKRITEHTKAIIVMHYGGYACDMSAVMSIADQYGLAVIEDSAHAIGVPFKEKMLGTLGDVGCFSFFSNKNLVTGEGGMLITNRPELAEKAKRLRSHGMTSLTWDRHQGHAWNYDVVDLGYNYRIDEIRAAIGLEQLDKLEGYNQDRMALVQYYRNQLSEIIPEIEVPFREFTDLHGAHIMPVMLPEEVNRIRVMEALKKDGIQTSIHYPPIHRFTNFSTGDLLPLTEQAAARELTLPLFAHLSTHQVDSVMVALRNALQQELS